MKNQDITHHIIIEGHFSQNGNFIGIDSDGLNIHVYKVQMDLLGEKSIAGIKFPLFAIGVYKIFEKLTGEVGDSNREKVLKEDGTIDTFERLTAMAIFKNFEDLIKAYSDEGALNMNFNQSVVDENTIKAENAFKKYFNYKLYNSSF